MKSVWLMIGWVGMLVVQVQQAYCQDTTITLRNSPASAPADALVPSEETEASSDNRHPNRWLVLMCGLPGDGGHRERLTAAVQQIAAASETVFDIDPVRLTVLVGDAAMADAVADEISDVQICTRQSVESALQQLGEQIQPDDACWVILLGHAQLYAGRSTFNIQGPDFDAAELASWMQPIKCRERVFFITMPVSGFWLKPLAGPQTVAISATDVDLEITATEMPYALADVLSGQAEIQPLEDIDADGYLTLLDLYLAVSLEVHGRFKSIERLQTEHAQLDDNGDGLGTEVQTPYLPVESDGEANAPQPSVPTLPTSNRDGDFSRSIFIAHPET